MARLPQRATPAERRKDYPARVLTRDSRDNQTRLSTSRASLARAFRANRKTPKAFANDSRRVRSRTGADSGKRVQEKHKNHVELHSPRFLVPLRVPRTALSTQTESRAQPRRFARSFGLKVARPTRSTPKQRRST